MTYKIDFAVWAPSQETFWNSWIARGICTAPYAWTPDYPGIQISDQTAQGWTPVREGSPVPGWHANVRITGPLVAEFTHTLEQYDTGTHALVSRVIGLDSGTKTPIAKGNDLRDVSYDGANQLTPNNGSSITNGTGVFRKSAYASSGGSSGESAFTMDGQAAKTHGASGMSFSQRIELGSYSGTAQLNGGLIEFMYIPSRLTNGQLQTITTA